MSLYNHGVSSAWWKDVVRERKKRGKYKESDGLVNREVIFKTISKKNQMKTFYRTAKEDVSHPEYGILLKAGDRVLTSEARTNDEGKIVVTVLSKKWFDVPISVFSEEHTKVFTNS